jgi:Amt family ammonium transporter
MDAMAQISRVWWIGLASLLIVGVVATAPGREVPGQDAPGASPSITAPPPATWTAAPAVGPGSPMEVEVARLRVAINAIWIIVAAILVMSLKAGFSLVETGLIRAKNVAHTMSMNFAIYAVAMMGYWACGFAFMFGGHGPFPSLGEPGTLDAMASLTLFGHRWDLLGHSGFFLTGSAGSAGVLAVFVFQAMLADTAATIPTGAMAVGSSRRSWFTGSSRRC